ncbi:MAG: ABC transporter ATP-binding protein [Candidatus Rokuibacteriota bacterium]|nr:MAG: ABC transporter ATP-binding protein [Candidatus Rokubacteria bacterium]
MSADTILRTDGLTCDFGALRAVNHVSLDVKGGTLHSVIGPNGSGKTTLFNLICGEVRPSAGRVYFEGREVTGRAPHDLPHLGLARCFQRTNVFPKLSVYENVWAAVFARRTPGVLGCVRRAGEFSDVDADARRVLADVGLAARSEARAETLSHGQQRALEVAVALASSPRLLLLDEPTQGLAPEATVQMTKLVQSLVGRYTILLIEHKMRIVMSISDRISVMAFGEVIAEGTPDEVRDNRDVQRAYLGARR